MSSLGFEADGAPEKAGSVHLPDLVAQKFASRLFDQDPTLWGEDAKAEASIRLSWVNLAETSRPLVPQIEALREEFAAEGVTRFILAGMGGSSLAPEVITKTAGVPLAVLDSTDPEQVSAVLSEDPQHSALVVSSKSGSTVETDSQRRAFEKTLTDAGIDPKSRIVVVTDPGSPLDTFAREEGYRAVFNADPNVGGRYSALTAFGLVPSGLAGANIAQLLDDAEEAAEVLKEDSPENIGLLLGSALGGTDPLRNKIVLVDRGSGIVGFADWAEQLIAESTGKLGTGLLPVVVDQEAPELREQLPDVLVANLVSPDGAYELGANQVAVSGSLGSQFLLWEVATAVAGALLGINPFDQPDVEAAKKAARGLLDAKPEPSAPNFTDGAVEVRAEGQWLGNASTLSEALRQLLAQIPSDGYLSVQAYLNRLEDAELGQVRDQIAALAERPVTFGWGPRFLHSTGQFHKGGPAVGVFLQITGDSPSDLEIPERPFTFGELIQAQAAGDAGVLNEHGRPVLRLNLKDRKAGIAQVESALADLAKTAGA